MTAEGARHRLRIFIVIAVAILILGGAGVASWGYFSVRESTDDAQVDGHINPVNVKVGGIVETVNVKENQSVAAGTILVQIDTRDYQVALSHAEADLADAEANYAATQEGLPVISAETGSRETSSKAGISRAQGGVDSAQKEIEAARARLTAAQARHAETQANYTKAARDLERMTRLVAKDEISQQQHDAAVATADAAKAAVESAQASILEAQSNIAAAEARTMEARGVVQQADAEDRAAQTGPQQIATTKSRIQAAAARVAEAKAALDQAKLNLDYTVIKAPVAGIVSRKNVEVGQVVQAGQPLLAIVPLNDIWITADFKETQLDKMRVGQAVDIAVDAYSGTTFAAHVESIAAATGARFSLLPPENASGNYVKVVQRVPVRIALNQNADPEHVLRPGMSVDATVHIAK